MVLPDQSCLQHKSAPIASALPSLSAQQQSQATFPPRLPCLLPQRAEPAEPGNSREGQKWESIPLSRSHSPANGHSGAEAGTEESNQASGRLGTGRLCCWRARALSYRPAAGWCWVMPPPVMTLTLWGLQLCVGAATPGRQHRPLLTLEIG